MSKQHWSPKVEWKKKQADVKNSYCELIPIALLFTNYSRLYVK